MRDDCLLDSGRYRHTGISYKIYKHWLAQDFFSERGDCITFYKDPLLSVRRISFPRLFGGALEAHQTYEGEVPGSNPASSH